METNTPPLESSDHTRTLWIQTQRHGSLGRSEKEATLADLQEFATLMGYTLVTTEELERLRQELADLKDTGTVTNLRIILQGKSDRIRQQEIELANLRETNMSSTPSRDGRT